MPTYAKSEDWLHQSSLLLEARPETTRITTRYTIRPHRPRTTPKSSSTSAVPAPNTSTTPVSTAPRGDLELKTYDPVSGVALKYRTVKLAEVGRLVQSLLGNQLGGVMAGVPPVSVKQDVDGGAGEDVVMGEAGAAGAEGGSGVATPVGGDKQVGGGDKGGAGGTGGGKGKKKKGKR
ncbi:signal recognition particle 9 kDa protein-domain-containing protein [Coniochaeta sp. 2T2.1]|nr:signal recognition particle 9 kDa protein-domain-containing protein [Coniochaeta sp. 2T2.1]